MFTFDETQGWSAGSAWPDVSIRCAAAIMRLTLAIRELKPENRNVKKEVKQSVLPPQSLSSSSSSSSSSTTMTAPSTTIDNTPPIHPPLPIKNEAVKQEFEAAIAGSSLIGEGLQAVPVISPKELLISKVVSRQVNPAGQVYVCFFLYINLKISFHLNLLVFTHSGSSTHI